MANSILNSHRKSTLHIDTTDGAITLAELTASGEATVVAANIVEIFWQAGTSITIDRVVQLFLHLQEQDIGI